MVRTEDLARRARREGKVVYCAALPPGFAALLGAAFEKRYGLEVDVLCVPGAALLDGSFSVAGSCDVVSTGAGAAGLFREWKAKGLLERLSDLSEWGSFPDGFKDERWACTGLCSKGLVYNTDLVEPGEAPGSIRELLGPRWRGRVVIADPRKARGLLRYAEWLERTGCGGREFFERLRENEVLVADTDAAGAVALVASGTRAVAPGAGHSLFAAAVRAARGRSRIAWKYPSEGPLVGVGPSAVLRDAAHPSAARLLMSFLMSREGQTLFAENGWATSRRDVDYLGMNPGLRPLEESHILDVEGCAGGAKVLRDLGRALGLGPGARRPGGRPALRR